MPQSESGKNQLVIVIDNSPTVRKIVEICLKRAGITCIGYADGITAMWELSTNRSLKPSVVLLDIDLPRMDGYQVAQYFHTREQYRDTAIVMLSTHYSMVDHLKSRLSGASNYITKPFKAEEMIAIVQEYITGS